MLKVRGPLAQEIGLGTVAVRIVVTVAVKVTRVGARRLSLLKVREDHG